MKCVLHLCQAAPANTVPMASLSPGWASKITGSTPIKPRAVSERRKASQKAPYSLVPASIPKISRRPSVFTAVVTKTLTLTMSPGSRTFRVRRPAKFMADAWDLALRYTVAAHGFDQIIHPPGADSLDVGLLDHGQQGALAAPPRLHQRGEVTALPDLGSVRVHDTLPGVPGAGAVTIAASNAVRRAFTVLCAGMGRDPASMIPPISTLKASLESPGHRPFPSCVAAPDRFLLHNLHGLYYCFQALPLIEGIAAVWELGLDPLISPKSNRSERRDYYRALYRLRHLVENGLLEFKQWRGVAARYAKKTASNLAICQLRAVMRWSKLF